MCVCVCACPEHQVTRGSLPPDSLVVDGAVWAERPSDVSICSWTKLKPWRSFLVTNFFFFFFFPHAASEPLFIYFHVIIFSLLGFISGSC